MNKKQQKKRLQRLNYERRHYLEIAEANKKKREQKWLDRLAYERRRKEVQERWNERKKRRLVEAFIRRNAPKTQSEVW
jgi:hypothetical protein